MIIGITGTNAAGKGTIVDALAKKGFNHFSVRNFLTTELLRNGEAPTRDAMRDLVNKLRAEHNPSYIVDRLYENALQAGGNSVIESFRCPGEIDSLSRQGNFLLFAVDAEAPLRYQRSLSRQSATDGGTFEDFKRLEELEMTQEDPWKQNISKCIESADIILFNNGTLEQFLEKVDRTSSFDERGFLKRRPTYAEIFINEAYTWATRATCKRRKVGAIIASADNVSISQGYNGSARGDVNCIDTGFCIREKEGIPSGQQLEKCNAIHAEANAILNAGRQGKSVVGATLYGTTYPCTICAGLIINSGIGKMVYDALYNNPKSEQRFVRAGVRLERFEGVKPKAFDRLFKNQ